MAEMSAVRGSTYTPISLAVLVDGQEVDVSSVTSGTLTFGAITVDLIPDTSTNRMTGVLTSSLTGINVSVGPKIGTGELVTNTGTYTFPDNTLTLLVLDRD